MRENGEMFIAGVNLRVEVHFKLHLRTVPTIVIAHTFCASPDTRTPIANAY